MGTLASPVLQIDRDASTPAKRDHYGIAGWTEPGAKVDILFDGTRLSTVTADANGRYVYQFAQWPAAGTHDIVAVTHHDGLSATSKTLRIDIGNEPPAVPTITSAFHGNYYIHAENTSLYGFTTPGATVRILSNGTFLTATRADESGLWHAEPPKLPDGAYSFSVTATNNIGTTGGGASWNVRVDEHAPDAPVIMLGNDANNVLSGERAEFSGTAEAATTITLSIDGTVRGQTVSDDAGRWAISLDLGAGRYQATVTATDGKAQVSAPSRTLAFSVSGVEDVAGDTSTGARLAIGASVTGAIEKNGDRDWFKVALEAQTLYRFTLTAAESNAGTFRMMGTGLYEDYLRLWDPLGTHKVGYAGPTGQNEPVSILFAPATAGDYFLDMGANYVTGSYTLSAVQLARDDHGNDVLHASVLPLNGRLAGVIDYAGDVDQFSLSLRAGVSYTVTLESGGAAYGTVFRTLEKSGGPEARISGSGGRWDGINIMSLVPSVDGVYTIGVSGGTGDAIPYQIKLTEAPDDYLAGVATTGRVLPGAPARGTLESGADADWFKAALTAGQSYLLQALRESGERLDLTVFDAAGKHVVFDASTVYGADSLLWQPPASGDYYFQVTSMTGPGAYTLQVKPRPADDFGANLASAGILTPAASVAGALETPGDTDWLRLRLSADSDYVFTLDTRSGGHTLQSQGQLRLLDGTGLELAAATSGSASNTAQLVFRATRTGDYYLEVAEPLFRKTGSYAVSMYASDGDTISADVSTSATLSPGGMVNSQIDFATDSDWVRVHLLPQRSYEFELTGAGGRGGTLPSNALSLRLVDANGAFVADQRYLFGKDPTLGYSVNTEGNYYLVVSAAGNATGSYTLKASDNFTPFLDTLPPLLRSSVLPVAPQVLEREVPMFVYFDEAIRLGTADITLRRADGELVEHFSVEAGNLEPPVNLSSLRLMSQLLEYGTDYVLTLAPGSLVDNSNHSFAGATLHFRTSPSAPRRDGDAGDNVFHGRDGDELIDGKAGRDTVVYQGSVANYAVSKVDGGIKVDARSGTQGHDTLVNIERVIFADLGIAYDTDGNAGQAYRLYQAAFDRSPDRAGLGYWIAQLDQGASMNAVASAFLQSTEFVALYGAASSDLDFVRTLYSNILHRAPDQPGVDYWKARLDDGVSRADVLIGFSESTENQAALIGQISKGMAYLPYG
ncbi:MAG: DUF4214 domain-containing protein [Janthinobacterium lividum]